MKAYILQKYMAIVSMPDRETFHSPKSSEHLKPSPPSLLFSDWIIAMELPLKNKRKLS